MTNVPRPPARRAVSELRRVRRVRSRRVDRPARGTQEFLGRGAEGPQPPGRGKRPGGFDPEELFGAALRLTHHSESRGAAKERGSQVPVVTTQTNTKVVTGDGAPID